MFVISERLYAHPVLHPAIHSATQFNQSVIILHISLLCQSVNRSVDQLSG